MFPKLKKLVRPKVTAVALVDEGCNLTPGIYKRADESLSLSPVFSQEIDEEKGILHGIVYAPYMVDGSFHYMDPEGVIQAAHSFAETGMQLDIMHGDEKLSKDRAVVVESSTLAGLDKRYPTEDHLGREIRHEGAWAIQLKLGDAELRKAARDGKLSELSLACKKGDYELVDAPAAEVALLKRKPGVATPEFSADQTPTATDMDPEKLKALIEETLAAKLDPLTKRLDDLEKPPVKDDKEEKKEEPKFDPENPDDIQKMLYQTDVADLRAAFGITGDEPAALQKSLVSMGAEKLAEYNELLKKLRKSYGFDGPSESARGSALIKRLKGIGSDQEDADNAPADLSKSLNEGNQTFDLNAVRKSIAAKAAAKKGA